MPLEKLSSYQSDIQLANCLTEKLKIPETAVKALFQNVFKEIEENEVNNSLDQSLKDRAWELLSEQPIQSIKEFFLSQVCDKVLGCFNKYEIQQMWQEHQANGAIKHPLLCKRIRSAYQETYSEIFENVTAYAKTLYDDLAPRIALTILKERLKKF